jgi:hypothetical protein
MLPREPAQDTPLDRHYIRRTDALVDPEPVVTDPEWFSDPHLPVGTTDTRPVRLHYHSGSVCSAHTDCCRISGCWR